MLISAQPLVATFNNRKSTRAEIDKHKYIYFYPTTSQVPRLKYRKFKFPLLSCPLMDCGFRVAWLRKTGADCASREQHRVRRCLPLIYLADFVQNNFVYTSKRRREPPVTPKGDKKKKREREFEMTSIIPPTKSQKVTQLINHLDDFIVGFCKN